MKLIIHFILVLLAAQSRSETVQSEDARVKWTYSTSSKQDSHRSLPDKVALTLTIASETTTLNLIKKQNSDFGEIPVLLGNNKNVITWNPSKNKKLIGLYSDISKEASFIISVKTENGVTIKGYRGSFDHNCIKYTLAPAKYHEKSKMTTGVTHTISLDGIQYDFYEESEQQTDTEDITDIANDFVERYPWVEAYAAGKERYFVQDRSLRRKRSSKKNLIMDLVVIIDNSMYTRWLKWSGNDMNTCIEQIQHYLAYIFEEVNNIYTSLPSYQITFKVVQIFIAQAPSQSDYLENSVAKQYEDKKKRNFKAALPDFTEWVNKHKLGKGERNKEKFLKQHDHAIAFTDYSEDPIPGAANLGGICSYLSQSIVRAADQHIAISTTAHEIGHALGSTHDGQGNTCDRQYLMSIGRPGIKPLNIFSSCSIDQIEYKIEALENAGQNCMDPSTKQRKRLDLDESLSSPPAARIGADRQCASIHGDGYKFCSEGLSTGSTMCNKLMCLGIQTKICQESKTRPGALDGTTCGKGKWCMKGQCVTGAEVKPEDRNKKEYCYFGDHSGAFELNNERTECKDFIKNPSLCYTNEAFCCDTCEKIKLGLSSKISNPNCPYGERGTKISDGGKNYGCELVFQKTHLCNQERYQKDCCESCDQVKKIQTAASPITKTKLTDEISITGCPNGDTLNKIPYGSKHYGCESVFQKTYLCNKKHFQKDCCESCNQVKKGQTAASPTKTELTDDKIGENYRGEQVDCNTLLQDPEKCYSYKPFSWRYKNLDNLPYLTSQPEYLRASPGFSFDYQLTDVQDFNGVGESEPNPFFYQNLGEAEYICSVYIRVMTFYNNESPYM